MLSIADEHKYEFMHRMFRETGPKEQGQAIFWIQVSCWEEERIDWMDGY